MVEVDGIDVGEFQDGDRQMEIYRMSESRWNIPTLGTKMGRDCDEIESGKATTKDY